MWLPWQPAMAIAAALAVTAMVTRPGGRGWLAVIRAFAREAALIFFLYAIWQRAGSLSVMHVSGARSRGLSIWHFERALHFPSELSIERAFLHHSWAIQLMNGYYAIAHVPALVIFLIWLFTWHRENYGPWRDTIALTTGACLLIQLVPVAPPRMFTDLGFVDAAKLFDQSVYGAVGSGIADQLSAMPSVHVGWAVIVGVAVVTVSRSKWRWLVLLHPAMTILAVTATANHWWLDGVVAVLIMIAAMGLDRAVRTAYARRRSRPVVQADVVAEPVLAPAEPPA